MATGLASENKLGALEVVEQADRVAVILETHDLVEIRALPFRTDRGRLVNRAFKPTARGYARKHIPSFGKPTGTGSKVAAQSDKDAV